MSHLDVDQKNMATPRTESESQNVFLDFRKLVYKHSQEEEELTRVYDEWAAHYTRGALSVGYCAPANLAAVVADFIGDRSSRILDAASGTGMLGTELKKLGFTCIDALDPSQGSLDVCKQLQAHTELICATLDGHQTKIPDDCYDAVVMCGAFGIPGHVTDTCFPELIRITKPGGYIMFTVSIKVLEQWSDKMVAAIQAHSQEGSWDVVEYRWIPYHVHDTLQEQAKVPILRVLKKAH